jgi:hypothetical protein
LVIFCTKQIGDVEGIDHLLAEGGDMRRVDVERQVRQNSRDFRQKSGTVEALDLDDGELVRQRRWR